MVNKHYISLSHLSALSYSLVSHYMHDFAFSITILNLTPYSLKGTYLDTAIHLDLNRSASQVQNPTYGILESNRIQ